MVFAHRPPGVLRFVAYSATAVDLALGLMLVVLSRQTPVTRDLMGGGVLLIATCWLPAWILLGVRYEIESGALIVRRGPVARRIPLVDVEEVRIAAPLPGLEGVIVSYRRRIRRGVAALYPDDPREFLRQVGLSASHLRPAGEGTLKGSAA